MRICLAVAGTRSDRIATRERNPKWKNPPVRIEMAGGINCDARLRCPSHFGAIFNHGPDVVIIPELCSGCDKCLPACPVDCIYPFPEWAEAAIPRNGGGAGQQQRPLSPIDTRHDRHPPGAEPWSGRRRTFRRALHPRLHRQPGLHAGVAEAFAAAGFAVELPLLPGHGTTVEEMKATRWTDWTGEVEAAYQRLSARADKVVVAGLSMGGSLTLWTALQHPEVAGICINPATQPQPAELMEMLRMVSDGVDHIPGSAPTSPTPTPRRARMTRRPWSR